MSDIKGTAAVRLRPGPNLLIGPDSFRPTVGFADEIWFAHDTNKAFKGTGIGWALWDLALGALTLDGNLVVSGVGPHAIGGPINPDAQLVLRGAFTGVNDAVAVFINSTITLPVGGTGYGIELSPAFVEAASGNHPAIASMLVNTPTITPGAATVTDAFTLIVGAAPVGVGAVNRTARFGTGGVEFQGVGDISIGGIGDPTVQLRLLGNFVGGNQGIIMTTTFNPVANASAFGIGTGITINKAASGTHSNFDGAFFQAPTIVAGAAALTNASTVKITGPPVGATNNFALWVDAGPVRWDDPIALGGGAAPTLGTIGGSGPAAAAQNQWLRVNISGTDMFIPVWA